MAYRIDKLGNSPVQAIGWARLTCVMLGLEGVEERLEYAEEVGRWFEGREEMAVWSLLEL
jgi:hypothetical protein